MFTHWIPGVVGTRSINLRPYLFAVNFLDISNLQIILLVQSVCWLNVAFLYSEIYWPLKYPVHNYFRHSSLLSVFGLDATSTYDSYLPLTFGKFALIWGHFQNILTNRFRGRWGCWGQTTSKSKITKILNENLLKLDEIQNLASATSKMTCKPQRPWKRLNEFFQKLHF